MLLKRQPQALFAECWLFNIYRPSTQSFTSYTARLLKIVSIYRPETQYFSNSFRPISQKLLNLQAKKTAKLWIHEITLYLYSDKRVYHSIKQNDIYTALALKLF